MLAATPTAGDHGVIVFDVFGYVARSPTHLPLSLPGPSSQRYLSLPTFPTGRYLVHPSRYDKVAGAPPGTLSLRSGFVLKRALRHKIAAQFGVDSQDLFLLDTGGPCGILLGLGCVRRWDAFADVSSNDMRARKLDTGDSQSGSGFTGDAGSGSGWHKRAGMAVAAGTLQPSAWISAPLGSFARLCLA